MRNILLIIFALANISCANSQNAYQASSMNTFQVDDCIIDAFAALRGIQPQTLQGRWSISYDVIQKDGFTEKVEIYVDEYEDEPKNSVRYRFDCRSRKIAETEWMR